VLVDGGPHGDDLRSQLSAEGVTALAAVVVTHDQADHVGGVEELLGTLPIHRLLFAARGADVVRQARAAGVRATSIAAGATIESGALRLEALWPPRTLIEGSPPADPNRLAIVLLGRWHRFSILLTADAEAEAVPLDPGAIDVLKIAHHGSDDAGLGALLERTAPRLAVVSVGAENPYGHPTAATLSTLAEHGIPTLRTDRDGDVTIDVSGRGWAVEGGD
jgi:competence protein ComEC